MNLIIPFTKSHVFSPLIFNQNHLVKIISRRKILKIKITLFLIDDFYFLSESSDLRVISLVI